MTAQVARRARIHVGIDRSAVPPRPGKSAFRILLGVNVLWLGLSMLSDGLTTLVLPHRLAQLTSESGRATVLGITTFVGITAGMLVQPVIGAASDALRDRFTRIAQIAVALLVTVVVLAALAAASTVALLVAAYVVVQLALNAAQAPYQALLPDLVPTSSRGKASGIKGAMDLLGALLGFVLLGALLESSGLTSAVAAIVAVLAGSLLVSAVLLHRRGKRSSSLVARRIKPFHFDRRRHADFARVVAARFLFLLGTYGVGRFFLFFVADRLGIPPTEAADEAGALLGILTLVTVISAVPAGWASDRLGRKSLMIVGALLSAAGVLPLSAASDEFAILTFGSVMAIGSASFSAANWAMAADLSPARETARFLGLANFGTAGAAAAAGLLGPLVDVGNRAGGGDGYTLLFIAAAVAFALSAWTLRNLGAAPHVTDPHTPSIVPDEAFAGAASVSDRPAPLAEYLEDMRGRRDVKD